MFQFPAFASYTLFYSGADTLSQCLETQAVIADSLDFPSI
jgi:hypothetical protein